MGLAFLQPWAWGLAAAVALPIAIHLLARNRSHRVPFPTTRFLEPTKLSAVTRQTLQDWPLLLVRMAVVLTAVAALAGPVVITPARQDAWAARVARAVVLDDRSAPPEDELRSAAVGATFAREQLRDAVADAVRWLVEQRPPVREVVVFSSFHRGAVDAGDFMDVPPDIGIRLVRSTHETRRRERETSRLVLREQGVMRVTERLTLGPATTEVREVGAVRLDHVPITVRASAAEQPRADAALRAVLRRGLRLPPAGLLSPITVDWPGEVELLDAALRTRLGATFEGWEPEPMPDDELAALARPPQPARAPLPEDEGDRRPMWAMVLVLLALEWWVRRGGA